MKVWEHQKNMVLVTALCSCFIPQFACTHGRDVEPQAVEYSKPEPPQPSPRSPVPAVKTEARRPAALPDREVKRSGVLAEIEERLEQPAAKQETDQDQAEDEDMTGASIGPAVQDPSVFLGRGYITAMDQSNDPKDLEMTRKIRRTITRNKSLSVSAKNILIVTRSGEVYLDGAVQSEEEKRRVESTALKVAGQGRVKSSLVIR